MPTRRDLIRAIQYAVREWRDEDFRSREGPLTTESITLLADELTGVMNEYRMLVAISKENAR